MIRWKATSVNGLVEYEQEAESFKELFDAMKNYKEYEKRFIGSSDIAALILVGCDENGLKTSTLDFGEDGSYMAYVVDEDAEIGAHYKKVADFKHWLKIYDDDELTYRVNAQEINIYRAGDFGCIIQTIGKH